MIKEIITYKTSDGTIFSDKVLAEEYEKGLHPKKMYIFTGTWSYCFYASSQEEAEKEFRCVSCDELYIDDDYEITIEE